MADTEKRLTGRIAREKIRALSLPALPPGTVERFKALGDCSGVVSDVMDELGIPAGVIGASVLRPTIAGTVMIGPALTVRNTMQRANPLEGAKAKTSKMAEFEAHNLATQGDVLVIQGVPGMSNMGGISALTGKRQGEIGAIVEGGVRDVPHQREIGYPIWSTEVTPVTGKWRLETVEINGDVEICGVRVSCGDLVIADDTGVCFVPRAHVTIVLEAAEKKAKAEAIRCKVIEEGMPVPDIAKPDSTYGGKA